jgi:hypothetical protein
VEAFTLELQTVNFTMVCQQCSNFNLDETRGDGYPVLVDVYRGENFKTARAKTDCELCEIFLQAALKYVSSKGLSMRQQQIFRLNT